MSGCYWEQWYHILIYTSLWMTQMHKIITNELVLYSYREMLVWYTVSARLLWKEQLTSLAYNVDCKDKTKVLAGLLSDLFQEVKVKEWMLKSTIFVKLKPTDPLQIMIVAMLSEENPPSIVSLDILATLTFMSRTWSRDKNSIVVLDIQVLVHTRIVCSSWLNWKGRMNMRRQ